jgi:hypothetical protein
MLRSRPTPPTATDGSHGRHLRIRASLTKATFRPREPRPGPRVSLEPVIRPMPTWLFAPPASGALRARPGPGQQTVPCARWLAAAAQGPAPVPGLPLPGIAPIYQPGCSPASLPR